MSYGKLYGREVFSATVEGKEYVFTCYTQGTSYGFRHICCEGFSNTTECRYVKSDIVAKSCYYNRTWESFRYETVLRHGIQAVAPNKEVAEKLHAILIDKRNIEEHEETERFLADFEKTYNSLSDANKEHLKNGIGNNLIQTDEQAHAVLGVMKLMSVLG